MNSYDFPIKSIYEILADLQLELERDHAIGQDVLELKVTKRFFDRLKIELCEKHNIFILNGHKMFKGNAAEVASFDSWTDTEIYLPCGSVIVRSE